MSIQPYVISLPNFEGPLDLLLFFIKRDELDIYDIPIAQIAEEFLVYTQILQMLDLEQAGDFIVMAAMLMQIKAKMLLPKPERSGEEDEEEDPRAELVRRLLEYRQYKEVADELRQREDAFRHIYYRRYFDSDERIVRPEQPEEVLKNVTLFDLLTSLKHALEKAARQKNVHVVEQIAYTVEGQAEYILTTLIHRTQATFFELIDRMEKTGIVVTFLAVLELVKDKVLALRQSEDFEDILVYKL